MLWFSKKKNTEINRFDTEETIDLLFIREKSNEYTGLYFKENGVPITKVFTSLEDCEFELLSNTNKFRLVIIEEGLGNFTSMVNRKNINSLLGICDGEDKKALLFYINNVLKSDNKMFKMVDYRPYKSTQDVIEILKSLDEEYRSTDDINISKEEKITQALRFKGKEVEVQKVVNINQDNKVLAYIMQNGTIPVVGGLIDKFDIKYY